MMQSLFNIFSMNKKNRSVFPIHSDLQLKTNHRDYLIKLLSKHYSKCHRMREYKIRKSQAWLSPSSDHPYYSGKQLHGKALFYKYEADQAALTLQLFDHLKRSIEKEHALSKEEAKIMNDLFFRKLDVKVFNDEMLSNFFYDQNTFEILFIPNVGHVCVTKN